MQLNSGPLDGKMKHVVPIVASLFACASGSHAGQVRILRSLDAPTACQPLGTVYGRDTERMEKEHDLRRATAEAGGNLAVVDIDVIGHQHGSLVASAFDCPDFEASLKAQRRALDTLEDTDL